VPYKTLAKWLVDTRKSDDVKIEEKILTIKP